MSLPSERRASPPERRRYHHGDLPAALLAAVEELVRAGGVGAVTLREAARRAGVSHAAPAHHFGDKAGLLTAFAIQGCERLRERLVAGADRAAGAGEDRLLGMGLAYIAFAIDHPEHFRVMFRSDFLHADDPEYRAACDGAFAVLVDGIRGVRTDLSADDPTLLQAATGAWSVVHGFATLWLDGNLAPEITRQPPVAAAAAAMAAWRETLDEVVAGRPGAGR